MRFIALCSDLHAEIYAQRLGSPRMHMSLFIAFSYTLVCLGHCWGWCRLSYASSLSDSPYKHSNDVHVESCMTDIQLLVHKNDYLIDS